MREPVLRARGVVKEYGEAITTRVLHGVDLEVARGELVALVGPSGSGKTTLLHLLGLLDAPTAGSILLDGVETVGLSDARRTELRGRTLGFIFQFHHLLPSLSAWENVMLPMAAVEGRIRREMRGRAETLLAQVGLADKAGALTRELSGGQQQRVAIARALAMEPPLVLADEPTGNLDTRTADAVFGCLLEHHRSTGTAFLIVTHDAKLACRCDRVVELIDGRVLYDGSADGWSC